MDAEKVIDILTEIKMLNIDNNKAMLVSDIINGIDNAIQTIRELQEQNKWHLVADGDLPNDRQWYLAMFQEVDTGFVGLPYIADYLNGKHIKYTTDDGWIICNCTDTDEPCSDYYKKLKCIAWRELPEFESEKYRMKIVIDIPKEFEKDYNVYRFKDFFGRVMADMNCLCGNYEKETAEMFIKSFDESVELADHDNQIRNEVIEEVKESINEHLFNSPMMNPIMTRNEILSFLEQMKGEQDDIH